MAALTRARRGPQLPQRWSGRYATALADAPGSAVLTLTSLGLIHRQNASSHYERPSQAIGLWKDDTGHTMGIVCPADAQGVVVTLAPEQAMERTLDGRANADTWAVRYQGQQPVRLPRELIASNGYGWIVNGSSRRPQDGSARSVTVAAPPRPL